MLSSALIIFREVLEAALIIGIVLSATRGVTGRRRMVAGGIGAGLLGACLIALFAESIAGAAQGLGQELLNAVVLFAAAAMLGWHNLWMARHGRELATQMNSVGRAVSEGARPLYALGIVVALAVLREGAEVVLFGYGLAAGGAGAGAMAAGAALGIVAGVAAGAALYLGLLRIPTRHLFTVTSWLLVLLASGLAASAAGYLVQAGMLPALEPVLWDTSAWLSQHSITGQTLHTLIGYTDRPSGMQVAVYAAVLAVMAGLTFAARRPAFLRPALTAGAVIGLGLTALLAAHPAHASHKVYYPAVEYGETEIELRGHVDFDSRDDRDNAQTFKLGVGHGFAPRWFTELYAEVEREPGESSYKVESYEWENLFQLTEQGRYWADLGLLIEYSKASESDDPDKLEITPIAQKQLGRKLLTVNVTFERETGGGSEGDWELAYAWQLLWLHKPALNFGLEGYGELGEVSDWKPSREQEHQFGPVLSGKLAAGGRHAWKYRVALLAGLTSGTPDATLAGTLEYEI